MLKKIRKQKNEKLQKEALTKQVDLPQPKVGTMGSILFDRSDLAAKEFQEIIIQNFGQEVLLQTDEDHSAVTSFLVRLQDIEFWCSYMAFPLPEEEGNLLELLKINPFLSAEEQAAFLNQQSFFMIAQKDQGATLEEKRMVCLLFSQLCGALMELKGAVGFFNSTGLLVGRDMYLKHTSILKKRKNNVDYFPVMLWILVYSSQVGEVPTIETSGLDQFGFLELQFYNPQEEWSAVCEKLYLMSIFQITGREFYKNMDTISFTKDGFTVFKQCGNKLALIGDI